MRSASPGLNDLGAPVAGLIAAARYTRPIVLASVIAIVFTLAYAAVSLRAGQRAASIGTPAVLLGVSAGCAVGAVFTADSPRGLIGPAELIIAPVVLAMLACCAMAVSTARGEGLRLLAAAGLLILLGSFAMIDRVDALSGQLLFVFGLALLWLHGSPPEEAEEGSGSLPMVAGLAGLIASAAVGYAIWSGAPPVMALSLVSANLLIWTIARRDFAPVATALVIGVCIAAGVANLGRIIGGATRQYEWAGGDWWRAIALELNSGPYVPGFSATAPDVLLLVLGLLLTVLASEGAPDDRRRPMLRFMLLGVCGVQAGWMVASAL